MFLLSSVMVWWLTVAIRTMHLEAGFRIQGAGVVTVLVIVGLLAFEVTLGIILGMAQAMSYVCDHPERFQKCGLSPAVLHACPLAALTALGLAVGACCFALHAFLACALALLTTLSLVALA